MRDGLLGRRVADIDIATPALPEAVTRAVEAAGLKAVPTGIAHGTVTAVVDGKPFEITTLRRDVETDGRHAVVAFTDTWQEDAARRDFTMNALYADRDGHVTDFFGGVADARAGLVRFIGDAGTRIREDALRILRFFRFHAWYGRNGFDPAGIAACSELALLIDGLSRERVRDETLKLLGAPDPAPVWQAMVDHGIAVHIDPSLTRWRDLADLVALEGELGLQPDPIRRLAALSGPISGDALAHLKSRLKLSNRAEAQWEAIDGLEPKVALVTQTLFRRALYGSAPDFLRDAALLAHVRVGVPGLAALAGLVATLKTWRKPRLPITASDLRPLGVAPGPDMGRLLRAIEAWWAAADFAPDRRRCLMEAARLASQENGPARESPPIR